VPLPWQTPTAPDRRGVPGGRPEGHRAGIIATEAEPDTVLVEAKGDLRLASANHLFGAARRGPALDATNLSVTRD
jgi:hypothetical protein